MVHFLIRLSFLLSANQGFEESEDDEEESDDDEKVLPAVTLPPIPIPGPDSVFQTPLQSPLVSHQGLPNGGIFDDWMEKRLDEQREGVLQLGILLIVYNISNNENQCYLFISHKKLKCKCI